MKARVIKQKKPVERTVELSKVDKNCFYGVEAPSGNRGFAMRVDYTGNNYLVYSRAALSHGNFLTNSNFTADSLEDYFEILINQGWTIYQFDAMSELALWLEDDIYGTQK